MANCRCGGPMHIDRQYLSDAERFGFRDGVPLLVKCWLCGRSERIVDSVPLEVIATRFRRQ